jgi:apolipoprotein N-acyltransferase
LKALPKDFLLAFISAALLVLSFPKLSLHFLAWIGLIPLFIALKGKSLRRAFALSFSMGMSFMMGIFYWINVIQGFELTDFILLGLFLGSYFGLFGLALNFISPRLRLSYVFIAPPIWVSMEFLRSHAGFLSLPWAFLGHSQYLNLPIIQISSFTGVYGVSFLIVMVNATLSEIILRWTAVHWDTSPQRSGVVLSGLVSAGAIFLSLIYGFFVMQSPSITKSLRVAVIQGNIPQNIRWSSRFQDQNLAKHVRLTREAVKDQQPALVVWPETAVRGSVTQNTDLAKIFFTLAEESNASIAVGSAERPKFGSNEQGRKKTSNSAFLISSGGEILGQYDKIRLLPFGEYLPFKTFPWPSRIASAWNAGEFEPGSDYTLLNLGGVKLAVTICWENIFPNLVREFVKHGADLIVNITNEAWFGDTAAPYQFMAMNVFRAVENRVAIARAANTGISGFIDPVGRILGTVNKNNKEILVEGYLIKDLPLSQPGTFYTRHGDLFALLCLGVLLVMLSWSFARTGICRHFTRS